MNATPSSAFVVGIDAYRRGVMWHVITERCIRSLGCSVSYNCSSKQTGHSKENASSLDNRSAGTRAIISHLAILPWHKPQQGNHSKGQRDQPDEYPHGTAAQQ